MNEELERDRVALKARIAKHNEKEKRRHRICWLYAAINAVFAGLLLILFVRWGRWHSLAAAIVCVVVAVLEVRFALEDFSIEDQL